jgi:sugar/nucleoside kinase (ribokinase family)
MNNVEIIVIGHILNEKIIFPDKVIAPVLGSPTAYSSVCIAKLGVKVGVVTKIGKDFPKSLFNVIDEVQVVQDGISVGQQSTNNELIYDEKGYKTLKYITRAEDIFFEDVPDSYLDAKIFYICPMDHEVNVGAIRKIAELGKCMAVDLGGYGGGTTALHPADKGGEEIKELCPYFSIVKASIEDCTYIFGAEIGNERDIAEKILGWGANICAITLGARGSFVKTQDRELYVPPFPDTLTRIADQTGAGDCYAAGFLTHFLRSEDPFASALFATATTSYVIERSGGVVQERMPDQQEVERRVGIINEIMA